MAHRPEGFVRPLYGISWIRGGMEIPLVLLEAGCGISQGAALDPPPLGS